MKEAAFSKEEVLFEKPNVKNFGYNISMSSGGFGYDGKISFDLGGGYKLPFYSQNQYLVQGLNFQAILGGTSWVTLTLWYLRLNLYLDLDIAQATLSNEVLFDVVGYSEVCAQSSFNTDFARVTLTTRIDVYECDQGILSGILYWGKTSAFCQWRDNYINYPLFDEKVPGIYNSYTKDLLPKKCLQV